MVRHFVHPARVKSKNDGDIHYVGFAQLCRLFKLNPQEAINMGDPTKRHGYGNIYGPDDRHYFPLYEGNYPLFDKDDDG
jgi:hypothetical protein